MLTFCIYEDLIVFIALLGMKSMGFFSNVERVKHKKS